MMDNQYNFKCKQCGNETYLEAENEYEKVLICEKCAECYIIEQKKIRQPQNIPKCPKCGSTAITAGQRGYSLLTGFLGSNKTVCRCANCGHTWKPGK